MNQADIFPVTNGRLSMSRTLAMKLLQHAQSSPDHEICGLVSAKTGEASQHYRIRNISPTPEQHFELCPEQHIAAQKSMRELDEQLLAIYHSHPTAPAVPSAQDIAECGYPEAVFLILSLDTKGVLEMRGWQLQDSQPQELTLSILD